MIGRYKQQEIILSLQWMVFFFHLSLFPEQNSTPILKQSDSVVENAAHQMRQSDPAREIYLHTLNEDTSDKYKMESYAGKQ